jgi:membrane dipeptidase
MTRLSLEEALAFNRSCPVVDLHCDTLLKVGPGRGLGQGRADTHLDLPRLGEAGVSGQFFACYIEPHHVSHRALERTLEMIEAFYREVAENPGRLVAAVGAGGIREAHRAGRVAGLLAVEGGEALQGNLGLLGTLYRLGVRSLTLTWNFRNALADGWQESRTGGGLSRFGALVVKEMGRLGMLVDVSHLSDAGFRQVLEETSGPVIASHSNARTVCEHPRNLTDEQIRALAARGGVMGLNLAPGFLRAGAGRPVAGGTDEAAPVRATLADALDHVDHIVRLVGPAHVGLGLDLDGISGLPEGFEDVASLPRLTQGLFERGHSPQTVRAILGGNFLRVMEEVGAV